MVATWCCLLEFPVYCVKYNSVIVINVSVAQTFVQQQRVMYKVECGVYRVYACALVGLGACVYVCTGPCMCDSKE